LAALEGSGQRLPRTPESTASCDARQYIPMPSGVKVFAGFPFDFYHQSFLSIE
jgi:hypothetical protein